MGLRTGSAVSGYLCVSYRGSSSSVRTEDATVWWSNCSSKALAAIFAGFAGIATVSAGVKDYIHDEGNSTGLEEGVDLSRLAKDRSKSSNFSSTMTTPLVSKCEAALQKQGAPERRSLMARGSVLGRPLDLKYDVSEELSVTTARFGRCRVPLSDSPSNQVSDTFTNLLYPPSRSTGTIFLVKERMDQSTPQGYELTARK